MCVCVCRLKCERKRERLWVGELVGERKRECLSERESERGKECVLCVFWCSCETERVHYRVRVCSFF